MAAIVITKAAWEAGLGSVEVGGLLGVLPVHSCLTADLLKAFRTISGEQVTMMRG